MTGRLVLGSEALHALFHTPSSLRRSARTAVRAARDLHRDVVVPAVVLAELYRGSQRSQALDAFLSREPGIIVRATDRTLARFVGGVLDAAGAGSEDMVDAHLVATAMEAAPGVVLTSDVEDLTRLAAPYGQITVSPLLVL